MNEYRFSDDTEFASKLKAFFSERDNRRTGRTFLLLRIAIENAIESKDVIHPLDHVQMYERYDNRMNLDMLYSELHRVLDWYKCKHNILIRMVKTTSRGGCVLELISGFDNYHRIKLKEFIPENNKIFEVKKFSKLLLII